MALLELLKDIATAIDQVKLYVDGDRSFNPKNTLNGIQITLTQVRRHMQRHAQDAINLQGLLNTAKGRARNYVI